MKAITLPYGHAGRLKRIRLVEGILAERSAPPFLYHDVLVLVPAARLRRTYGRIFLEAVERLHGAAALVQPSVLTLHQLCSQLYAKLGGPPVIDENSRLILLEGIVKELVANNAAFGGNPDILAPALSAAVADMLEQLSSTGVSPERLSSEVASGEFAEKPQVRLLTEAFIRYKRILTDRTLTDPAGMFSTLVERFDPAWLAPYSRIVIDGIHDVDELQARLLEKIALRENCVFLVDAPSPESILQAGEFHPLGLIKYFLHRLDGSPVSAGAEASSDDRFLGEALFSEKSFGDTAQTAGQLPSFDKEIRMLSAVTMREEVTLIAAEVKKSLQRGAQPDTILVAFPALDEYGPLAEEIFNDYSIPYNRALGRQLSASPVATALISLLRAVQDNFSGPSLLRVFSSPFLKYGAQPSLAATLDRVMRMQRITGGREKILGAVSRDRGGESGLIDLRVLLIELFDVLAPLSATAPAPLSHWMDTLAALMTWSGIAERVAAIKGPLNINLQACKKLEETLSSLNSAAVLFPAYRYTFSEWSFLLRKTLMHTRFQVPPEDEGGVQILGLGESVGHEWSEIYLGGLIDAEFPQRLPQNIFLPEASLEALGVRTLERARMTAAHHFYRLLLSAPRVMLTRPESEGDRPVAPSPFLMELEPLRRAGLVNRGIEKTTGLQFSLAIKESRSVPELAKAISRAGRIEGFSEIAQSGGSSLSGIAAALAWLPGDRSQVAVPQQKREFTVTELDAYLRCPYDYYVTRILGIKPIEEVSEDISPLIRGSKVHGILRNFYLSWNRAVTRDNRGEARALLEKLAVSAFEREADTFRNRRERELFLTIMVERFLEAEQAFWKQGMKPVYLEQVIERHRLTLPNGEEAVLTAKIDRIDADERGNFIVVDYKTGGYPLPVMNGEQDIFQLPVYAVMARVALKDREPALGKAIGLAYYDLAGKYGGGARDVVLFDREARDDHPSTKSKASPKTAGEFETILNQSMEKARSAIRGILAGDFTSRPQDENTCRYCPNEILCEKKDTHVS
jgi:ATP-dependent helicase/DNAse subunit B